MSPFSIRAVVPLKPPAAAKTRLAGVLAPAERASLVLWLLDRVLGAALAAESVVEVEVVGGDAAVRAVAVARGARWLPDEVGDLNGALGAAAARSLTDGLDAMVFLPGDLPDVGPADLDAMVLAAERGRRVVLARGDRGGTNAILVPAGARFRFVLGGESFRRHRASLPTESVAVVDRPGLRHDLDDPADLERLRRAVPDLPIQLAAVERASRTGAIRHA